mmetsp:Transcript_35078/g.60385  ORF Transcript_35078/g.60385 Transcript_35078/m.60385 type:complete len:212 (+) Transcript_35078:137-772(+)
MTIGCGTGSSPTMVVERKKSITIFSSTPTFLLAISSTWGTKCFSRRRMVLSGRSALTDCSHASEGKKRPDASPAVAAAAFAVPGCGLAGVRISSTSPEFPTRRSTLAVEIRPVGVASAYRSTVSSAEPVALIVVATRAFEAAFIAAAAFLSNRSRAPLMALGKVRLASASNTSLRRMIEYTTCPLPSYWYCTMLFSVSSSMPTYTWLPSAA